MRALFVALTLSGLAASANAAISVSHHNFTTSVGGTTTALAITADAGDTIILCAVVRGSTGSIPALSIAGGSLTWSTPDTKHTQGVVPIAGNGAGIGYRESCFSAFTSGALSGVTITVTSTITIQNSALGYMSISGLNASPFDPNVLAAAGANYVDATTATQPTASQTTTLSHDFLYMASGSIASFNCGGNTATFGGTSALSGFQVASTAGIKTVCLGVSWLIVSSPQSAISVIDAGASGDTDWTTTVDALTADIAVTGHSKLIQ